MCSSDLKITVKDECRNGSTYSDLNEDPKWIGWVSSNLNQLVKEASFCLNPNAQSCAELIIGTQPIAQGREENICDDWMLKFMKDTKPRMVIDTEWPNSWYLRDRECIETIKALPKDVLEILAESKWDAKSRESTHSGTTGGYGMSAISMLFSALADTPQVDPSLMDRLKSKLANSDIRLHYQDPPRNWVRETGPALLSAYQRCLSGKKFDEFQKTEKAFVAILSSPDFSKEEGKDKAVNWLNRQLQSICSL